MEPVNDERTIHYSDFMTRAHALAQDWKNFTYAVNAARLSLDARDRQVSIDEMYASVYAWYVQFKTGVGFNPPDRKPLFSPVLADSIRLSCAMKVIKDVYVVIPDEASNTP